MVYTNVLSIFNIILNVLVLIQLSDVFQFSINSKFSFLFMFDCDFPEEESYYYDSECSSPIFEDDSQMFHHYQILKEHNSDSSINDNQISFPDSSIAFCHSIEQSQNLIYKRFNLDNHSFRSRLPPGLIILPLKEFNLIRKDNRCHRDIPHVLFLPEGPDVITVHRELMELTKHLN